MSEALAKTRAAVAEILKADTGEQKPKWRTVYTDSESATGIAPVCSARRDNGLHEITDFPGGPIQDEQGVYDCCPWPQIETASTDMAAYLVELLNADRAGGAA